jgi:hypothetical protein
MNDHIKLETRNLSVPVLCNSQLLRARNVNQGASILNLGIINLANLKLAHPELIEVP